MGFHYRCHFFAKITASGAKLQDFLLASGLQTNCHRWCLLCVQCNTLVTRSCWLHKNLWDAKDFTTGLVKRTWRENLQTTGLQVQLDNAYFYLDIALAFLLTLKSVKSLLSLMLAHYIKAAATVLLPTIYIALYWTKFCTFHQSLLIGAAFLQTHGTLWSKTI